MKKDDLGYGANTISNGLELMTRHLDTQEAMLKELQIILKIWRDKGYVVIRDVPQCALLNRYIMLTELLRDELK